MAFTGNFFFSRERIKTLHPSHHTPYHPKKLALRARRVNPALDPGGSGRELVGKVSRTEHAGVARGSILQIKSL